MKKIFYTIIIVNLVLIACQFSLTSLLATEGDGVRAVNLKKTRIAEENFLLQDQISRFSALSFVEQRAVQLGMLPAKLYTLSQAAIADARSLVP